MSRANPDVYIGPSDVPCQNYPARIVHSSRAALLESACSGRAILAGYVRSPNTRGLSCTAHSAFEPLSRRGSNALCAVQDKPRVLGDLGQLCWNAPFQHSLPCWNGKSAIPAGLLAIPAALLENSSRAARRGIFQLSRAGEPFKHGRPKHNPVRPAKVGWTC